jgi:hypothetical protein
MGYVGGKNVAIGILTGVAQGTDLLRRGLNDHARFPTLNAHTRFQGPGLEGLRVSFRWLGRAARFRFAPAYTLHGIPSAHRRHCRVTAGQSARRTASGSSAEREKGVARNTARRVSCRILPGRRIHATLCACTRHVTGIRSTPPLGRMDFNAYEAPSESIPAPMRRQRKSKIGLRWHWS